MASRVLFGSTAALAWIIWSIMSSPANTHASLHRLGRWLPLDWVLPVKPGLIAAALLMTLGWLWLLPVFKYTGKWRGVLSWCAGAILAWGLVSTLLLPWLDYGEELPLRVRKPRRQDEYRVERRRLHGEYRTSANPKRRCCTTTPASSISRPRIPAATECTWLIDAGPP